MTTTKKYKAPAAEKMLDILELMAKENKYFSVTELSQRLSISSNSVFRIMKELEDKKFIQKNPLDSSYQLTGKLYYLGSSIGNRIALKNIAEASMLLLRDYTRETTLLTKLGSLGRTLVVDQLESLEPIKFLSTVGLEYPSHTSAMGKCLLAFSPPSVLEQYLEHNELTPVTSSSIAHPSRLKEQLEQIRETGYATDMEESCEGLRCLGAPIFNAVGEIEGAIGISGPIFRMSKDHMNRYNKKLLEQARHISELLGYDASRKA
ncbi:IclR family transcriptional regulator [Paenibacillus sp. F411]|uniref:Transcriptional regulator n=1 Tax=Paenibacillus algicola TaxID=2565926 RepID=A0A4P8XHL6_9BACL|nr:MULTISPECIES: IclR family transcriptional regulator [Paenibacillus]MBO2945463.1 IclR family transcriptional regulator [Paenibacillus sp. F411]QCT00930.1 transcriptional regulator [Paenibacillus algicola]